jgi:hypothetical protein
MATQSIVFLFLFFFKKGHILSEPLTRAEMDMQLLQVEVLTTKEKRKRRYLELFDCFSFSILCGGFVLPIYIE